MQIDLIKSASVRHGYDCPSFGFATVLRGTPTPGLALPIGTPPRADGLVEFVSKSNGTILASMSTRAGAEMEANVAACEVRVTPKALADLVEVEVWSTGMRAIPSVFGTPGRDRAQSAQRDMYGQTWVASLRTKIQHTDTFVRHGQPCPGFVNAVVSKGTGPAGASVMPSGYAPLPEGIVQFRDRLTKAVLASMSTRSGTVLSSPLAECEVYVTPPALQPFIEVRVLSPMPGG